MNPLTIDPGALRRVLLVRLDSLGDVLMCSPAIQAVRRLALLLI